MHSFPGYFVCQRRGSGKNTLKFAELLLGVFLMEKANKKKEKVSEDEIDQAVARIAEVLVLIAKELEFKKNGKRKNRKI